MVFIIAYRCFTIFRRFKNRAPYLPIQLDTAACLSVSFYFLVRCKTKVVRKIGRRRCSEMVNVESGPASIRSK